MQVEKQLEIIKRGCSELIPEEELVKKLEKGKPLKIKWGADPSAPDIHLGHTVVLNKLRDFQELGHEIVFLIGDFTARIGDPSGKSATRKPLSKEEVKANSKTYQDQVFKILDKKKTKVVYNSKWLSALKIEDVISLAAKYTVARMLERDDFMNRFKKEKPILIHEFLYPLLQGYDSVVLKADVEVGGTDQKFNMLVGRELQREYKECPQVIITMPILEGTDGVQKMSKSLNNYIGVTEPPSEIFGKIMSISDELMHKYYKLLADKDLDEIKNMHPKEAKKQLAAIITARFYSKQAALEAEAGFESIFAKGNMPEEIKLIKIPDKKLTIIQLLVKINMVESFAEAKRLIKQGGVRVNGEGINDEKHEIDLTNEKVINVGKRKFLKVICE
ncbi:MAG: tyrosyl-tRNA synthetase [Candidatus Saganbacteria bacterium]|uniref:Tyrosine--tRNA ligase n=1 Tax=Candidatus Saganbacteria bacterium TaxID=2575572 RepID=A0A833KZT7_UNCSA|nr:MAG: tyrosyl-tRNA synthetase [Candidatus Saganbacteria bacterium]